MYYIIPVKVEEVEKVEVERYPLRRRRQAQLGRPTRSIRINLFLKKFTIN